MTPLETGLRGLCATLDDAALETLASRGLLRRAQKDRERGVTAAVLGEAAGFLTVRVGDATVSLPATGPATARCSCPAAGACHHVLGAVLFLRETATAGPPEGAPSEPAVAGAEDGPADRSDGRPCTTATPSMATASQLLNLTPAALETWAGRRAFREGRGLAGRAAEVHRTGALRVRFTALNLECRFVAGGGLDGAIVSAGRHAPRSVVVAAVIAVQQSAGQDWKVAATDAALAGAAEAPRTRDEVLAACGGLLREMLSVGLAHLSEGYAQRWATLAVAALGCQLPRLALLVRGLGEEVSQTAKRDAQADLERLLHRMSQAHALAAALKAGGAAPRADLVGQHRTRYEEVGSLELLGVAAWPWRTVSGFEGITVLFWEPASRRWNTWTEARPRHPLAGFNPAARFTQPGPWEGAGSPQQLVGSVFRLINARRNPWFRLSGSGRTRALVTGPVTGWPESMPVAAPWTDLGGRLAQHRNIGLREADPLAAVVALVPRRWEQRGFDAVTQTFRWILRDEAGTVARLQLPFNDLTERAIRSLESVSAADVGGAMVIGRAEVTAGVLTVHPFGLWRPGRAPLALAFSGTVRTSTARSGAPPEAPESLEEADEETPAEAGAPMTGSVARLLDALDGLLLEWAEGGIAGRRRSGGEHWDPLAGRIARCGLETLAAQLRRAARAPGNADELLRTVWLVRLHRAPA